MAREIDEPAKAKAATLKELRPEERGCYGVKNAHARGNADNNKEGGKSLGSTREKIDYRPLPI
jgi:hypothetical protein